MNINKNRSLILKLILINIVKKFKTVTIQKKKREKII